jgi:hypothetical protein
LDARRERGEQSQAGEQDDETCAREQRANYFRSEGRRIFHGSSELETESQGERDE